MKNSLIKMLYCSAIITLSTTACRKDTALTTDRVPPKVTFKISGAGNNNSFEASGAGMSPSGEYVFKENTRYTFTVSISDTSGLGQLIFKMTKGAQIREFTLTGAPEATEVASTTDYHYSIIAERTDPYKSFVMTGNFLTGNSATGQDIRFSIVGRDYLPNQTTINLNGTLHTQSPTGVFGWNPF
jgi:hypothetical protein